jgi:hypothetical protein
MLRIPAAGLSEPSGRAFVQYVWYFGRLSQGVTGFFTCHQLTYKQTDLDTNKVVIQYDNFDVRMFVYIHTCLGDV